MSIGFRSYSLLSFLFIYLFSFSSCRKGEDAVATISNIEGTWYLHHDGDEMNVLQIKSSGDKSSYQECFSCTGNVCTCHDPSTGKAKVNGNTMYIGWLPKFNIDQKPYLDNGTWYMVLDGKKWSK